MSDPANGSTSATRTIIVKPLQGAKPRVGSISLVFPVEVDGKPLRTIHLRRLSVGELGIYFDRLAEMQKTDADTQPEPFPGITDEDGVPIPADVLKALDPDDEDRLNEALVDFLPARLRPEKTAPSPSASPSPSTGVPSDNSLAPLPDGASPT